jgi:hypothetical protein
LNFFKRQKKTNKCHNYRNRKVQRLDLLIKVARIAIDLRLRRLGDFSLEELVDAFFGFELIFTGISFLVVARFNFVKNSFVINFGSFNNGIYFPSSKNKNKFIYY